MIQKWALKKCTHLLKGLLSVCNCEVDCKLEIYVYIYIYVKLIMFTHIYIFISIINVWICHPFLPTSLNAQPSVVEFEMHPSSKPTTTKIRSLTQNIWVTRNLFFSSSQNFLIHIGFCMGCVKSIGLDTSWKKMYTPLKPQGGSTTKTHHRSNVGSHTSKNNSGPGKLVRWRLGSLVKYVF